MALNGNGTSQFLSLGTATVVSRNIPLTIMALVDSTSLRTAGNFSGIFGQGDYSTAGGMSFQLEISAAASPLLVFSASAATGVSTWTATQDSTGGPVVTANTGWWLVAACVRKVSNTLAVQYYAYRFNTGTLTTAAGSTISFTGATQLAPPAATAITAVAAEGEITVTDWFPGGFAWCGVWNADLSFTQNANPPAIWEAIAHGPLALADSTLAGLWILDNSDAHDYSTGAHNGTYVGSPTFVGTPVTVYPPISAYRTSAPPASGSNALAGTGSIVSGGTADLSQVIALAATGAVTSAGTANLLQTNALAGSAQIVSGGTAALSTTGSNALAGTGSVVSAGTANLLQTQALVASGAIVSGGTATLLVTKPLAGSGSIVSGGTAALTNSGGGSGTANFAIGVNTAGTGGNDMSPAVVRDSSNRLWRAAFTFAAFSNSGGANNGNTLRMFRADQDQVPSSFTEQDSAHRPTNVGSFSMAIDGSDLIHVAFVHAYTAATTGVFYTTFNTTTNLWGSETQIGVVNYPATTTYTVGDAGVCLALDAAGIPHVVHYGQTSGTGATHIFYTNKVGGTWSTALQLDGATLGGGQRCMHPQCMFDSTGALHVVWMTITANYGTTLEKAYYVKRSAAGSFGSVQTFAENLLGSIDNGPSVYVDESDRVHVAYGLGDGANPVSQAVTGATVNNSVFYRFSTDGGATWNTTTQPAHIVSHDFSCGPDGFGGVRIHCHSQPTTVDGLGTAVGYLQRPLGGSWAAWTQTANDANGNGYDCTVSPRRERFFRNRPAYLDTAFFDLNLPASAMLSSDPAGNALVGQIETGTVVSGGTATLSNGGVNALAGSGVIVSGGTAALTQTQALAGTGAVVSGGTGALTQTQALASAGSVTSAGTAALTQVQPLAGTGAITSGGTADLTNTAGGAKPLAGTGAVASGGTATLSVVAALAGTGAIQSGGTAALAQTHALAGGGTVASAGTATLRQTQALAGVGTITSGGTATLSNGTAVVLGTATLSDRQLTTIALSDGLVTRVVLTCTDEEGVPLNSYVIGNVVSINVLVKDINLSLVDAATTTVTVKPQGGTPLVVTPTRLSTGTLQYNWDTAANVAPGTYGVRAATTNPNAAAEAQIYIEPTLLT